MNQTENSAPEAATSSSKPRRVLLVDDDSEIVEAMRYALEANGFEVSVARDGNQGLALTETCSPTCWFWT